MGALLAEQGEALVRFSLRMGRSKGKTSERLYERRLRRYLTWSLQWARAKALQEPSQLAQLFAGRLCVELVPGADPLGGSGHLSKPTGSPQVTKVYP